MERSSKKMNGQGLVTWLSSEVYIVFLQNTGVPFPALTLGDSRLSVTPAPGLLKPLTSTRTYAHSLDWRHDSLVKHLANLHEHPPHPVQKAVDIRTCPEWDE